MELLMNNHLYSKYLAKTDPQKYEDLSNYRKTITKHHDDIMDITSELLSNPNKRFNNELDETFNHFAKACIKYLENQSFEQKCTKDSYSDDEDEVLFDEKYMEKDDYLPLRENTSNDNNPAFPKSFWGKQVRKSSSKNRPASIHHDTLFVDNLSDSNDTKNIISRDLAAFSGKKLSRR